MGPFVRISEMAEAVSVISLLNQTSEAVVVDIETTGLDRFKDTIISAQVCIAGDSKAYYFEAAVISALSNITRPLILHNFKFDAGFLIKLGINIAVKTTRDTMLMHHLKDENAEHGLDAIVQEKWKDEYKSTFWSNNVSFQSSSPDAQLDYSCRDVVYTGLLYKSLVEELRLSGIPDSLIDHVHRLALALYDTEMFGVRVDLDYLSQIGEKLKTQIDSAHIAMRNAAPEAEIIELEEWSKALDARKTPRAKALIQKPAFNWDSPKQLQRLIYGELGIKPVMKVSKHTKERSPTLDDAALEYIQHAHPLLPYIRDYRADKKVFGSFIEGTLERQIGGRIYPHFHVNGTVTGRISSSNPNLQQLPRDGGVRGIYCADEGNMLISCDYAMLEVVVAAHYSQDPALLKIINDGASKHDITAAALGIDRQTAKTVNFAAQYQCSHYKLAHILKTTEKEGQYAWNKYWETYAGEKKVIDACKEKVDKGYPIINIFGRQRRFPTIFASEGLKAAAHRQAYSSLIQGTGADITHTAFYSVHRRLVESKIGRALFQVHDELLIQAQTGQAEEAKNKLIDTMLKAGQALSVKLGIDCSEPMIRWQKG